MRRIYLSEYRIEKGCIYIENETSHYIKNVLRLVSNDVFIGFDGSGWEYVLKIKEVHNNTIKSEIKEKRKIFETEPAIEVILCISLTKNRIFDKSIEKAVEIGVKQIIPVKTTRSNIEIREEKIESKLKRWRRILSEGSKISGRGSVPEITCPVSFKDAINIISDYSIFFWEQAKLPLRDVLKDINTMHGCKIKIFIGPEGGFTEEEANLAKDSGAYIVSLGKRILRVETAVIIVLGIIFYQLETIGKT